MDVKHLLSMDDMPDVALMGGKAHALAKLGKNFPVPAWFVVSAQAAEPQIGEGLLQALNKLGACLYAVRSSAVDEDGRGHSFAGQLQSFLNVEPAQVYDRIMDVRRSGMTDSVRAYRQQHGLNGAQGYPAVLIQKMVYADVAGVAFTVDPISNDTNIITIIATPGLADKLVSGEINGDTYRISRSGHVEPNPEPHKQSVLSSKQLKEISSLAQRVERHFGCPQDIEWAYEGGRLYLLQARPITTLENDDLIIWDNSNIVESYSGITSPLTFSFARYVYGEVYKSFSLLMGVPRQQIADHDIVFENMLGYIQGHVYYNLLNWYRALALFPGFALNRAFMENMMGVSKALPDHIINRIAGQKATGFQRIQAARRTAWTFCCLAGNAVILPWRVRIFYKHLDKVLAESGKPISDHSFSELVSYYRRLETELLGHWHTPIINDFLCMIAFGASRKLLMTQDKESGQQLHNDYMIGQGDIVSAEPAQRIRHMADIIRGQEDIIEALIAGDVDAVSRNPVLHKEFKAYLDKFGDRCTQELKLESLTLQEDPATLLQAIGYTARKSHKIVSTEPVDIDDRIAACFPGQSFRKFLVTGLLRWTKKRVRDRENLRFERTRVFGRVRRIFLEMGHRLTQQGMINDPRDVFYLQTHEVLGLVDGIMMTADIRGLIALRRADADRFRNWPEPPSRFETSGAITLPIPVELAQSVSTAENIDSRSGLGCCRGQVRAPVRVIHDPRTESLQPGEILVAKHTDPGWIALFSNAAGIIVERGSLLSHSAIVAREMGIPAIVAVPDIMTWLTSGDIVEMDGASGKIVRVDHEVQ